MEFLEITRAFSRESTRPPEEAHRATPQAGKQGKRKAFGPEAEAAELTKMREGKGKAHRTGAGSSPFLASQQTGRSSVYSRDPRSSQTEVPDDGDEARATNRRSSSRNLRPRESRPQPSPNAERQEKHRRDLEQRFGLQRPGTSSGQGSSSHSKHPFGQPFSSEEEVPEAVERPFPQQTSRRHVSAPWPQVNQGESNRTVNSSPSRPANWDHSIDITGSDEAEEPVEPLPSTSRFLSPDGSPPRVPPKPSPSTSTGQLSRAAQMRRKDGSRPGESKRFKATMSKTPRTELPSSNLARTSVTPAAVAWAFIVADSEEIPLRAENASLRSPRAASVLELFSANSKSAELPLSEVTSVQSNHAWFLRLEVMLTTPQRNALRALCPSSFVAHKVLLVIALREEASSQNLIAKALEIIQRGDGQGTNNVVPEVVDNAAAKVFRQQWEKITSRAKASKGPTPASRAAEAAEKRAEAYKGAKGKGTMTRTPSQPTLNFDTVQPLRRSARKSGNAPVVTALSDDEITASDTAPKRRSPRLDKHEVLFPYPFTGRSSLDITKDSLYRLLDGDFLNDVTLEFGLRYTVAKASRQSVHLFNSFFYNKLSSRDKKARDDDDKGWAAYESVKKWTKAVDVFQQDFIIVPVNENLHWYLAVILNPRALIERQPPSGPPETTDKPVSTTRSSRATTAVDMADDDRDPLDCISDRDDSGVNDVKISESDDSGVNDIKKKVGDMVMSPKPITSVELDWINGQDDMNASASTPPSPTKPKKTHMREAYDMRRSDTTYIMTFDSLGGSHKAVGANLKRWLECEAREKLQKVPVSEPVYLEAKVPQQDNFSDCGVFVIHYVWCLLNETDTVLDFIGKPPPYAKEHEARAEFDSEMNRVWHADTTRDLRTKWIEIINRLNDEWRALQGPSEAGSAESQSLVNGSQASVVQVNPPEVSGTLPAVREGHESEAASSDSAPASKGILSPSPTFAARSTSRITSPETRTTSQVTSPKVRSISRVTSPEALPKLVRRRSGVVRSPQQTRCERSTSDYPNPLGANHSPPLPQTRGRRMIQESDSENESSQPPSRARSASTKASSRSSKEEVDGHILVEDSQPESAESAPSVLFSGDEAQEGRAGRNSAAPTQDTAHAEPTPVHDSSDDGRVNNRIDLSSDQDHSRYSAEVRVNPRRKRNRDSSRFDGPSSSAPLSSPPPEDTAPLGRRLPAQPKQKQSKVSSYFANGTKVAAEPQAQRLPQPQPRPQPRPQERERECSERPDPSPAVHKKPYVEVSKVKHTYTEKSKRKASMTGTPGAAERKRPRPSHDPAAGGSVQNPIDLDPSDEE